MLISTPYDRSNAIRYAETWAMSRNPDYLNFDGIGGDCTNFASQCILAGSRIMNYTPVLGWFYKSSYDRTASWSGVPYLFNFLTTNKGVGPYAAETDINSLEVGDIIQLGDSNHLFYHTSVVTLISQSNIFVSAHSYDAFLRPLSSYTYENIRYLHIQGVRKYQ